jgi:uncharacterized protein (DUF4213/DUF364 family)
VKLLKSVLKQLPEAEIEQICIGLRWTAVVSRSNLGRCCGLATTRRIDQGHGRDTLQEAGSLHSKPAKQLAAAILEHPHPLMHSVALATINSMLMPPEQSEPTSDAEEMLAHLGAGKHVAVVGHFPFSDRLSSRVGHLDVLEKEPRAGDLPAEASKHILPECDVIALTAMTLLNKTFETLQAQFASDAVVMMLGPSTPLSPLLFSHGLHYLAGSVVEDVDGVMAGVAQSASYRQLHKLGVRKVMLTKKPK